jgi:hypothetical protein
VFDQKTSQKGKLEWLDKIYIADQESDGSDDVQDDDESDSWCDDQSDESDSDDSEGSE